MSHTGIPMPADFAVRAAGLTIPQIMEEFGVTNGVATRFRKESGLSPVKAAPANAWVRRTWSADEDAYLRAALAEGRNADQMAAHLGLARSQVTNRLYKIRIAEDAAAENAPRAQRWSCDYCGTRSDAALDFGCGQCLPVRREVA